MKNPCWYVTSRSNELSSPSVAWGGFAANRDGLPIKETIPASALKTQQ
jgi:hypothetical protein